MFGLGGQSLGTSLHALMGLDLIPAYPAMLIEN